jgi:DNA-directed RNA polymerase III subunit RPC1
MSAEEIHKMSELEVWEKDLYNVQLKTPALGGALDRRLGTCNKDTACETCGKKLSDCVGHFGHIRLALPVLHAGYLKATIQILQQICKVCDFVPVSVFSSTFTLLRFAPESYWMSVVEGHI